MSGFDIPVIDVAPYVDGGSREDQQAAAEAVDRAAAESGFFQIRGHCVPTSVISGLSRAMDQFFALPLEEKTRWRGPPEVNRGYSPPRSESLSLSLGIAPDDDAYDLFEAFNVGTPSSEIPGLELSTEDYPENLWPSGVPHFQAAVGAYVAEAARVAHTLTQLFADALGLARDYFAPYTDHSVDVLRMNNFAGPVGSSVISPTGMGAHTDYGIVTVLWVDQVPGLQVLGTENVWHEVTPQEGCLLVNLGDLTARWTNDRWRSSLHRVIPPVIDGHLVHRRSAAFFHDGNADAVIETLPSCRDEHGDSHYGPTTVAEHLRAKLGGSRVGRANTDAAREAARAQSASDVPAR